MNAEGNNLTVPEILSELRKGLDNSWKDIDREWLHDIPDRIEASTERERRLLRTCARWILCHDIYGNMAKELLEECREVLGDDGRFLDGKEIER